LFFELLRSSNSFSTIIP